MSEALHAPLNSRLEKQAFYRMVFMLVLPIAAQNLINTAVSSADVVMLKYVGQDALAAVSAATQVSFILGLFFYGLSSGASVLTAQYWGKQDYRTIERIMGIAFRISMAFAAVFALAALFFPSLLMRIFTSDEALVVEGVKYLRVVAVSFLFMSISSMYLNMMRSMERVVLSTVTFLISFLLNVALNATFIFGLFGMPRLGVVGVALATSVARFVEMLICFVDAAKSTTVKMRVRYVFERNPELTQDFFRYSLPSMGNELIWGTGFSMYTVIMGHLSSDALAANSIVQVVRNLATVVGFGLANGTSVVIGKALGEGRTEAAREYARRMFRLTLIAGLVGAVIMVLLRPLILAYGGDLTQTAQEYLGAMLWINVYYVVGMIMNTFLICGVFRAGGDVKFGFYCDTITLWGVFVPLGLLCGYVFKLPVMVVYLILCLDEGSKFPVNLRHYYKSNWARNITRDWN